MSKSNYLELAILNHVFGKTALTQPTHLWVSLHTADPGEDASGAECDYTGYGRTDTVPGNWGTPSGGQIANSAIITCPQCSGGTPDVATHFGIWDDSTSGNLLYSGALGTSKTIDPGDTPSFAIGALVVTED